MNVCDTDFCSDPIVNNPPANIRMDSYNIFAMRALTLGAGACFWYLLVGAVQRLYFSPIAAFPGPKLAALTFWYSPSARTFHILRTARL
jgi:hypothetical protein